MADEEIGAEATRREAQLDQAQLDQFTRRLIGLARAHLDARLQHKIEPEDVVQSAYKSFLLRYGQADIASQGVDALWSLLTLITLRKCADRVRYLRADCRDVTREAGASPANQPQPWQEAVGREPTPEHAAVLAETVEQILREVEPDQRPVIELSFQGYSAQEVSQRLGRAERSVRRLRQRLKKQLQRRQSSDALT